jgi:hypothetical protein
MTFVSIMTKSFRYVQVDFGYSRKITLIVCFLLAYSAIQAQTIGSTFQSQNGAEHQLISSIGQPYALHSRAFGFNNRLHQGQILPKLNPFAIEQLTLKVFPNPARELIHIQFSTDQAIRAIEVRDINGRIMLSESFEHPQQEAVKNINDLHPGIYTISATSSDGQRSVTKISKVKSIHQP